MDSIQHLNRFSSKERLQDLPKFKLRSAPAEAERQWEDKLQKKVN